MPARIAATRILSLAAAVLLFTGCASLTQPWKSPQVQLRSIAPERIGLTRQRLRVGLDIHNPNDRTLPIKAMTYKLSLEGTRVAEGGGTLERQIPAGGTEPVEVSVESDAAAALALVPTLALRSDPISYRISGNVTVAGVLPIPYRYSGEVEPQALLRTLGRGMP